jgi:hypothetical protein
MASTLPYGYVFGLVVGTAMHCLFAKLPPAAFAES